MHVYKWYNEQGEEYDIHLFFNLNYLQRHGISGFVQSHRMQMIVSVCYMYYLYNFYNVK